MAARGADRRLGVIALARMSSRRLPGKALAPLAGRPMVLRVLDRLARVRAAGTVILATSTQAEDDPLAELAGTAGVAVHRGPLDDVAGRFLDAMQAYGLDRAVRVSGDSPFIDPALIDRMVALAEREPESDVVTNVAPRSFPPGCSVEIIRRDALARAVAEMTDPADREHVTPWFYRHPERFCVVNHAAGDDRYRGITLTVDSPADLARAERLAQALGPAVATADLDAVAAAWRQVVAEEGIAHAG